MVFFRLESVETDLVTGNPKRSFQWPLSFELKHSPLSTDRQVRYLERKIPTRVRFWSVRNQTVKYLRRHQVLCRGVRLKKKKVNINHELCLCSDYHNQLKFLTTKEFFFLCVEKNLTLWNIKKKVFKNKFFSVWMFFRDSYYVTCGYIERRSKWLTIVKRCKNARTSECATER